MAGGGAKRRKMRWRVWIAGGVAGGGATRRKWKVPLI